MAPDNSAASGREGHRSRCRCQMCLQHRQELQARADALRDIRDELRYCDQISVSAAVEPFVPGPAAPLSDDQVRQLRKKLKIVVTARPLRRRDYGPQRPKPESRTIKPGPPAVTSKPDPPARPAPAPRVSVTLQAITRTPKRPLTTEVTLVLTAGNPLSLQQALDHTAQRYRIVKRGKMRYTGTQWAVEVVVT